MPVINELPFTIDIVPGVHEYPLPHFATKFPAGLQIDQANDGVLINDVKWARNSHFANMGSIDPKLFKKGVRFKLHRPPYPKDLVIDLSTFGDVRGRIQGKLLVADKAEPPFSLLMPFELHDQPPMRPWENTILPGIEATAQARPQVAGAPRELLLPEHIREACIKGAIEIRVISYRMMDPVFRKNIVAPDSERAYAAVIDANSIRFIKPHSIAAGEVMFISAKNMTADPIQNFSCAAVLDLAEVP